MIGHSVMESIRDAQIEEIQAICGGACACCTCHVLVDAEQVELLPPLSAEEDALLDGSSVRTLMSRLSCQLEVTEKLDGLRLTIAPEE
ncbi:2Fe-2S iron-sulfur cluster-binding protein [Peristeroidobacter soli]|jgi:2Fe-2S ferredoxin|uniref:2Fe-2S iron-sulfur cluster-binding protein n=1 Tax=Peristeroidobacter soli TaxID=2497877 RepID=UPI001C37E2E7|nr:2Fe-2S iron-sulfur cluster-binding protein [Peristeroidobacter soli]